MGKKKTDLEAATKPWGITQADLDATTQKEWCFATDRCYPPADIIPPEYWVDPLSPQANLYVRIADALWIGEQLPEAEIQINQGFTGDNMIRFLEAHLRSVEPTHEHKIAGLAYMIAQIITLKELP